MECKERTPSVIARLMGLDTLPPQQQPSHKQHRALSENYLRKTASIGVLKKRPFKMKMDEHQEDCKDTFQVPQDECCNLSFHKWKANVNSTINSSNDLLMTHSFPNSLNGSLLTHVARKHISERLKTTKMFQETGLGRRGCSLGDMLAMKTVTQEYSNMLNRENTKQKAESRSRNLKFRSKKIDYFDNINERKQSDGFVEEKKVYEDNLAKDSREKDFLEQSSMVMSSVDGESSSSQAIDSSDLQETSTISSEDASQPSKVSILESPSQVEFPSNLEDLEAINAANLRGLWMQIQLLNADSLEECSEELGLYVSSDEDDQEESANKVKQNKELIEISNTKESRDFSYLVDVLYEAGLSCHNLETCLNKWHSLESPINPRVFETLEKKYGPNVHWEKSERRLLFDRINSSLMVIFPSCLITRTRSNCVSKILSCKWCFEVIEEELWTLLVIQERESGKNLSKIFWERNMDWLQFCDDFDEIIKELERSLIDELALECLTPESF